MGDLPANAERLRLLHALTDVALSHLEFDELLSALLERAREILGADCSVVLDGHAVPESAARVDETGKLAIPLLAGDEVIGVLQVERRDAGGVDEIDVELAELVADRIASALEHARLYESERAARIRLEHVQAVTDAALAHLEIDDLFEVLLPRIRNILSAETCAVLLLDEERAELVARAAVGIEEEVERGVRIPLGRGFAGRVAAENRPVVLDDVDHADVLNPILREKGIKSLLGVPLVVRGQAMGVLHVGSLTHRTFTEADIELLQLVADRLALAIERARLHEEVVLLDQLKLNFVAIASHELRTPAASVYGVLATLAHRGDQLPAATREELIQVGYEHGERLRRLIEQLLDLSRLDSHAITVEPKPVVLQRVLTDIAAAAVPADTPLEIDVAPDVAVVADALVLDRVLSNLLINAVRYGEPPIVVGAEQRDRHIRIAVEDHGPGVPPELQPRLFERFARGDAARGSGLGLAIARAYARAHGGDLVYSPGERGARFELIVPRA
jgi:signal transduction histidine kinase